MYDTIYIEIYNENSHRQYPKLELVVPIVTNFRPMIGDQFNYKNEVYIVNRIEIDIPAEPDQQTKNVIKVYCK